MKMLVVLGCILLAFGVGMSATNQLLHAELWHLAFVMLSIFIALFIQASNPVFLVPYIIFVWAVFPEIRRILDYLFQEYSNTPLLALAPLIVNLTLLIPISRNFHRISTNVKKIVIVFALALIYGLAIGFINYGIAALYEFTNYATGLLLFIYINICDLGNETRERWLRSLSFIGVGIAMYGIYQYFYLPPWDQFWMINSEMLSIGAPEPLSVRVFSTLNSPGPAGVFLTMVLGFMIVQKKWRSFGIIGVLIVLLAVLLTLVRSAWIGLVVMLLAYLYRAKSIDKIKLFFLFGAGILLYLFILPNLSGAQNITNRMSTFTTMNEDVSFNERLSFSTNIVTTILSNPIGRGLGATGLGTKLYSNASSYQSFDNGYLNLFYTFGLIGGLAVIGSLFALLVPLMRERRKGNDYADLSFAGLGALLFLMLSVNVLTGVSGVILWFIISVGFYQQRSPQANPTESV
ncbi:MAG: O-antigen ligase family protein [Candidatus Pristimantibacillus sp.]